MPDAPPTDELALLLTDIRRDADISADGVYRYRLRRQWARATPPLCYIMLNPSTADAAKDDQTIRRCMVYARDLGYGGIAVWNLYAFRTYLPVVLAEAQAAGTDVVGPDNDQRLTNLLSWAQVAGVPVVAGWGAQALAAPRVEWLLRQRGAGQLHCLGVTKGGHPVHPLRRGKVGTPALQPWPVTA